jgi:hypothetical protein
MENVSENPIVVPLVRKALVELHKQSFFGKAIFQKDDVERVVYFENGKPVYVESSVRSETLGHLMWKLRHCYFVD